MVWLTSKLFRNGDLAILLPKWVLAFSWKFCLDEPLYTHLRPEFLSLPEATGRSAIMLASTQRHRSFKKLKASSFKL